MKYVHHYKSPIGNITMTSDGKALTKLYFNDQKYNENALQKILPIFEQTDKWLDIYFQGIAPDFIPVIKIETTPFRKTVWEILLTIGFGQTRTYGEIAAQIAKQKKLKKMSAQAVGGAVGHNPIALIIPCHRVVGANGNLKGYAAGLDKKIKLLELEKPH